MPNEDFFNRIKSKLSGIEPEFDPGDWAAMEAMLDRKRPIVPLRMMRVAAGLALFVLGYLSYSYFSNADNSRNALSYSSPGKNMVREAKTSTAPEKNYPLTFAEKEKVAAQKREALPKTPAAETKTENPAMAGNSESPASFSGEKEGKSSKGNAAAASPGSAVLFAAKKQADSYKGTADPGTALVSEPGESIVLVKKETLSIGTGENKGQTQIIPFEAMIPNTENRRRSWWIGMTANPGLQFVQNTQGSFARGVVAGMTFPGLPLSIETGILEDRFRYAEAPAASLFLGENHTESEGSLSGISIPLKANFHFRSRNRVQAFLSTGLTAFIPVKEQYVFSFDMGKLNNQSQALEALIVRDTFNLSNAAEQESKTTGTLDFSSSNGAISLPGSRGMYLLASAGGGLNFQVNPRLGFQMSAHYSRSLGGMGIEQRNMNRIDLGMAMHYFIN